MRVCFWGALVMMLSSTNASTYTMTGSQLLLLPGAGTHGVAAALRLERYAALWDGCTVLHLGSHVDHSLHQGLAVDQMLCGLA